MKARGVVLAVAVWLVVVASTSALAWVVIDNAGRVAVSTPTRSEAAPATSVREDGAPGSALTTATGAAPSGRAPTARPTGPDLRERVQVGTPTSQDAGTPPSPSTGSPTAVTTAASTPAATTRATATPKPPQVRPQEQVDRSTGVIGGQVGVRCVGARIALRYAQPDNGWSVEVGSSGPQEVEVTFKRVGDGAGAETHSRALCQGGTPTFTQESGTE